VLKFYTVLTDKPGYPIQYLDESLRTIRFAGPFDDPGEASREFQAYAGSEQSCYLEPTQFQAQAKALRKHRSASLNREVVS
jgi:hypothetical protein